MKAYEVNVHASSVLAQAAIDWVVYTTEMYFFTVLEAASPRLGASKVGF